MNFLEEFFVGVFPNVAVAVVFIAMLPVVELRGAIPFGVSEKLWGASALGVWQAMLLGVLSCVLVASVLLVLLLPVFGLLKKIRGIRKIICYLEERFQNKADKFGNSLNNGRQDRGSTIMKNKLFFVDKQFWFVVLFSAVPLPLTGVWTASAIAVFLGMGYIKSLLAISMGTVISGLVIVGLTLICGGYSDWIFRGFMIVGVAVVLGLVVWSFVRRNRAV